MKRRGSLTRAAACRGPGPLPPPGRDDFRATQHGAHDWPEATPVVREHSRIEQCLFFAATSARLRWTVVLICGAGAVMHLGVQVVGATERLQGGREVSGLLRGQSVEDLGLVRFGDVPQGR